VIAGGVRAEDVCSVFVVIGKVEDPIIELIVEIVLKRKVRLTDRKKDRNRTGPDCCATRPAVAVMLIPAEEQLWLQQIFRNGRPQETSLDRSGPILIGSLRLCNYISTLDY
jgi:hypothetical protein